MAETITEGLQNIARSDLSGLKRRLESFRLEVDKIRLQAESSEVHESFIAALKRAKEVSL